MIYITKIEEKLESEIKYWKEEIKDEIKSKNIRILGHHFFEHNKNKAKLIINNKKYELKEIINCNEVKDDKIKIKMILSKELSDIKRMFKNCYKLKEILFVDNIINFVDGEPEEFENNYNDYNIDYNKESNDDSNFDLYENCGTDIDYTTIQKNSDNSEISNYSILRKIINNITANQYNYIYDMSQIFSNCISLSSLPDISKWNTNNINYMSDMFSGCSSLSSIPDISKWNTEYVTDMWNMFYRCLSLSSLPDISKWDTNNVEEIFNMFSGCSNMILSKVIKNKFHN